MIAEIVPPLTEEAAAWAWLTAIPRLPWREYSRQECDTQIRIEMIPGTLGTHGTPLPAPYLVVRVRVASATPGVAVLLVGSGNSLAGAVFHAWQQACAKGIDLPMPEINLLAMG